MAGLLDSLIISPAVRGQLDDYLERPIHSIVLYGVVGAGLGTIASAVARDLAGADVVMLKPTLHNKQKTRIINADDIDQTIPILRDRRGNRLAVVIDDIDQTAPGVFERMLKLVEEPVGGVHYILTTHDLASVPATILSRSGLIKVGLPSHEQCQPLVSNCDKLTINQINFIADRRPAMICRLLNGELDAQALLVEKSKGFLSGDCRKRLEIVDGVSGKEDAMALCDNIARLIKILLRSGRSGDPVATTRRLNLLTSTADNLRDNGNVRLQLTNLAVNF